MQIVADEIPKIWKSFYNGTFLGLKAMRLHISFLIISIICFGIENIKDNG